MTTIVEENKVNKLSDNFENQDDNCDKKIKKLKDKKNEGSKKKKRKFENGENFDNQPEIKKNKENFEVNHDLELMETSDPSSVKDPSTEEAISDPEDQEETEAITSEDHQLTVKYFRNSFTSTNAFGALRKFVALGSTSPGQILADYLDSGGNVMEILRLLDGLDKKRLNDVALVFNASALVIMRTIATHPQQQPSTIQACRFILNTHISLLRSLMSKSVFPRQRKSALKLLTSMVMLGDSLPRDILTHLTFDRETTTLLAKQTKPSDPESVRVCFINFLLAFLIDTEPWTVRCLIDKPELLVSIFPELTFDRANLVHLVLNVLKKYLLENPVVSKTQKHHLFGVQVIESIVQLYNYRGPRSWSDSRRKNSLSDPPVQDKEIVISATHEFLITLLTSAKHGIIFRDQNLGTRKDHNSRVAKVIQNLDKPWNHSRPRELVTRILGSCPDLVKLILGTSEPFFEPRPNRNWINLVSFYRDVLSLNLDSIRNTLITLSVPQCINVTLTLAAPASVLRAVGPSVTSEHLVVRFQGLLTLGAMLIKVRKFFAIIDDNFSEQNAESYRVSIQNYLAKHLPKVADVLRAWNELRDSVGESQDQEFLPEKPSQYLDAVLTLLENYRECNQEPGGRIDFDFDGVEVGVKVRIIEVNYWLDPKAYDVKEKLFNNSLTFLVESLESPDGRLVGTLKTVLGPLKPFQDCLEHLDIWIQAFGWISKDQRAGLAKWVVNLLRKISKCPEKFANVLKDAEKALKKRDKEVELGLVPMVFVAAISSLRESFDETVNVFLGHVTILTLHSLRDPRILAKLVENTDLMTKYLKGWLDGEVRKLKDFPCELMSSVSKYLLSKKDINLETLERLDVNTELEQENLFRMILFYFTNLVKMNQETGARKCKVALLWILKLMKSSEELPENSTRVQKRFRTFAKLFAKHPVVLKNFSFLATENFGEIFISKECFDIFALIPVLDAYKDKMLSDLSGVIDSKFTDKIIDKIEYFDIFEFSVQEIRELLSKILELKSSKFYQEELTTLGRLVSKLLEILATKSLDFEYTDLVMKFWRHLGKLKTKRINTSAWESAILMFLDKNQVVLDKQQFKTVLTDLRDPTIALINLLVKQNHALVASLSQFLLTEYKKPEILFPLIEPNLEKLKPQLLTTIFANYAPEILAYFDEVVTPWIDQFPSAAQFLISKKFSKEQCQQVADKLLESREKLERINSRYLALVSVVWEKRAEFESPIETVEEYLQILLPIAVSSLKKAKKEIERLDAVTCCMVKALDKLERLKPEGYLFEKIVRNNAFKQLVNYSLKHGLKVDPSMSKDKVIPATGPLNSLKVLLTLNEVKVTPVVSILDVLSKLLNVAYSDSSSDNYAEQIYHMMRTNSNFEEVLLSKSTTKVSLLRLFLTMTRKVPGKIQSEDLKLLMRAYEATLNPADQLILMILQFYESHGLYLETGLLWGRGATNHTGGDVDTNLWRQVTASQTLELLDQEIVSRTVKFYPIDRGLRATKVLEFESEIYDPAFYLPLMVTLSTADKLLPTNKLVKSGAMALVLSSCASNHSDVRLAAFTALSQFYYHFDAAKNKDKMIWLRCIDALRNGVTQLMGPEAKLETLRLSSLITTFLARTSLISAKDGNVMFAPIQGYFMAKQALDLKVVPEFLTLFHSSDVNHKSYRHWMLECVRDGIKCYYDVKLAFKMSIFKMIMDFYGSVLADNDTRALILQIIEATVKIPRASVTLIKEYSLFNWLHELAPKIDQRNHQVVDILINILKHLSRSRLETNDKALKDHAEFMVQMIVKASN